VLLVPELTPVVLLHAVTANWLLALNCFYFALAVALLSSLGLCIAAATFKIIFIWLIVFSFFAVTADLLLPLNFFSSVHVVAVTPLCSCIAMAALFIVGFLPLVDCFLFLFRCCQSLMPPALLLNWLTVNCLLLPSCSCFHLTACMHCHWCIVYCCFFATGLLKPKLTLPTLWLAVSLPASLQIARLLTLTYLELCCYSCWHCSLCWCLVTAASVSID